MFKSILVAVDLDEESSWRKALPEAVELARAFGARLRVATVVRDIGAMLKGAVLAQLYEQLVVQTEDRLKALVKSQVPEELQAQTAVGHGSIYGEILRIADDVAADLIVMASHRPEMKDYLLGANAARVVRHARVSVLIVRE